MRASEICVFCRKAKATVKRPTGPDLLEWDSCAECAALSDEALEKQDKEREVAQAIWNIQRLMEDFELSVEDVDALQERSEDQTCGVMLHGLTCTRAPHGGGNHVAAGSLEICARWPMTTGEGVFLYIREKMKEQNLSLDALEALLNQTDDICGEKMGDLQCTRRPHIVGDHVATGSNGKIYARWSQ